MSILFYQQHHQNQHPSNRFNLNTTATNTKTKNTLHNDLDLDLQCKLFCIPLHSDSGFLVLFDNQISIFSFEPLALKHEIVFDSNMHITGFSIYYNNSNINPAVIDTNTIMLQLKEHIEYAESESDDNKKFFMVTSDLGSKSVLRSKSEIYKLNLSTLEVDPVVEAVEESGGVKAHQHFVQHEVREIIKNDQIAAIISAQPQTELQLLNKKNHRQLQSKLSLSESIQKAKNKSLIWSPDGDCILVIHISESESGPESGSDHIASMDSIDLQSSCRIRELVITKFPIVAQVGPSNALLKPFVFWSDKQIFVHRIGGICINWYELKNSEIWDVIDSQVGRVLEIQVSADSTCLYVKGIDGVALCDFAIRMWRRLPFSALNALNKKKEKDTTTGNLRFTKWLGSDFLIGVVETDENIDQQQQQIILIPRSNRAEILNVPIKHESAHEHVKFIDTYNNWQLLLQIGMKLFIYAFDSSNNSHNGSFVFVTSFDLNPFWEDSDSFLKQAAFINGQLLLQFSDHLKIIDVIRRGKVDETRLLEEKLKNVTFDESKSNSKTDNFIIKRLNYESFIVLSTGHFLLSNGREIVLWREDQMNLVESTTTSKTTMHSFLGIYPSINCMTILLHDQFDCFSLRPSHATAIRSKFLLPDLFVIEGNEKIVEPWLDDPIYPLTLEYLLLKSLDNSGLLKILNDLHSSTSNTRSNDCSSYYDKKELEMIMSRALVGLTRKIEVHEASHHLFAHLPDFSPLSITRRLIKSDSFKGALNFLPYLAKSYFESVPERKESISTILDFLFTHRSYYSQIGKVEEYLSAFADLEAVMLERYRNKLHTLWRNGRVVKATHLIQSASFDNEQEELNDLNESILPILKLDIVSSSSVQVNNCLNWLKTESCRFPQLIHLLQSHSHLVKLEPQ